MVSAGRNQTTIKTESVLILIILEDGFCFSIADEMNKFQQSLNPYYTGRWFLLKLSTLMDLFV